MNVDAIVSLMMIAVLVVIAPFWVRSYWRRVAR